MGGAESEILAVLREGGRTLQSELARSTGYSRATVSEALGRLERKKMVTRTREGRNSRVSYVGGGRGRRRSLRVGFTRSAEYPFLVPLRRLLRDEGLEVEFQVYDQPVSVARALSLTAVDVGVAPLTTLFLMHSLDAPLTILGPAGAGGSCVMEGPGARPDAAEATAVCTRASTMEALVRSAERRGAIPRISSLEYAPSPAAMEAALMSGGVDLCSIWEPYATILEAKGARRLVRYSELGEHVCCAAAAGNHLGEKAIAALSRAYAASLEAVRRGAGAYVPAYAALSGLDASVLRRVEGEYTYPVGISPRKVADQLRAAGMLVPAPESFAASLSRGAR